MPKESTIQIHQCECSICREDLDSEESSRHEKLNRLLAHSPERQRRLIVGFLSQEAESPSDRELSSITGLDRKTIQRGRLELESGVETLSPDRQRHPGAGRPLSEKKTHS